MIRINANTRISEVLKGHPAALETIIGISPRFARLRNPLLRRLMAARTSIAAASRMGGCTVNDFFTKLKGLGFVIGKEEESEISGGMTAVPAFMQKVEAGEVVELDVRPVIEGGKDPLGIILAEIRALPAGMVLKIVNSFEPSPLIILLENKGFQSWTETIEDSLVYTYFFHPESSLPEVAVAESPAADDWEQVIQRFAGRLTTIDVRSLEMPMPMLTIIGALDNLCAGEALFVHHKRIPVFLLPELAERGFEYRVREIDEANVRLLIFKNGSN
ncbi:MAG: DUF2249 domain-containing protein [Sphingobacteriales bacterium]|nr:DUF2249 domain-containing protein [Sphingobacteriales bacterium]